VKGIRIWQVVVFNIITLGLYSIFWVINRSREMAKKYKRQIPHWGWYAGSIVASLSAVGLMFASLVYSGPNLLSMLVIGFGSVVLAGLAALHYWWFWKFSKAVGFVTDGRVSTEWSFTLYFLAGSSIASVFLQYYFNRTGALKDLKEKPRHSPSSAFITWAIVAIVSISLVVTMGTFVGVFAGAFMSAVAEEESSLSPEAKYYNQLSDELLNEYNACVEKLDAQYPEVTFENEEDYNNDYDACEVIRKRSNDAVVKYNEALF
jgi:hypothetical protein